MLDRIYYWLDLYDPRGKPSHSKVMATFILLMLSCGEILFGAKEIEAGHGMSSGFLLYTLIVSALPWGLNGLKAVLAARFGGLDQAKVAEEAHKADVLKAETEAIIARRKLGADDGTEPV